MEPKERLARAIYAALERVGPDEFLGAFELGCPITIDGKWDLLVVASELEKILQVDSSPTKQKR